MTAWLGVVSAEHVRRGVAGGFAQIGHGKRAPLARLHQGDTLVYYSPRERLDDTASLRQFTAIGVVADDTIWQVDEGDFKPFRRKVDYEVALPVAVADVVTQLDLTAAPSWGYALRRGLVPLTDRDAETLRRLMVGNVGSVHA